MWIWCLNDVGRLGNKWLETETKNERSEGEMRRKRMKMKILNLICLRFQSFCIFFSFSLVFIFNDDGSQSDNSGDFLIFYVHCLLSSCFYTDSFLSLCWDDIIISTFIYHWMKLLKSNYTVTENLNWRATISQFQVIWSQIIYLKCSL